jgi:tRNA dimethylallyltransferase
MLDSGVDRDSPAMEAIGYCQIADYLMEVKSYQEAIAEIRKLTRQFVRRQYNWFKLGDPTIRWFTADPSAPMKIIEYLNGELSN